MTLKSLEKEKTAALKKFVFNPLPYAFEALEPFIDKHTVEIHYGKHHKAYYDNFIKAIHGTALESMQITDIFKTISQHSVAVRNNAGGYFNHTFYWENMKAHWESVQANGHGLPTGKVADAITKSFGTFADFRKLFSDAAKARFGSGWTWLTLDDKGKLFVSSTPNQDNPLMDIAAKRGIPLLAIDVWEHAYYLMYQNKRPDYVEAFWSVVNWNEVDKRYEEALKTFHLA